MNPQLATMERRTQEWWYVRPQLLASLVTLLVVCAIVWALVKTHVAQPSVKRIGQSLPVIELANLVPRALLR